jgi:hypothetical protein
MDGGRLVPEPVFLLENSTAARLKELILRVDF